MDRVNQINQDLQNAILETQEMLDQMRDTVDDMIDMNQEIESVPSLLSFHTSLEDLENSLNLTRYSTLSDIDSDTSSDISEILMVDDVNAALQEVRAASEMIEDFDSSEQIDMTIFNELNSRLDHEILPTIVESELELDFEMSRCNEELGGRGHLPGPQCRGTVCEWTYKVQRMNTKEKYYFLREYQELLDHNEFLYDDVEKKTPREIYFLHQEEEFFEKVKTLGYRVITRGTYNNLNTFFCMIRLSMIESDRVRSLGRYEEYNRRLKDSLSHHPYVKYFMRMTDTELLAQILPYTQGNQRKFFLSEVYMIRQVMDDRFDYGLRTWIYNNVAEGLTLSSMTLGQQSVRDLQNHVMQFLKSLHSGEDAQERYTRRNFECEERRVRNWINSCLEKVFNFMSDMLAFVVDFSTKPIVALKDYIKNLLWESAQGWKYIFEETFKKAIVGSAFFITIVSFAASGLISYVVTNAILKSLNPIVAKVSGQVAESNDDVIPFFRLLFVDLMDMDITKFFRLEGMLKRMLILLAGGTVVKDVYMTILTMLPHALRTALVFQFGSKEQRLKMRIDDWRLVAQSLCSVSKQQKIAVSKVFATKVKELMREGNVLIRDIKHEAPKLASQNFMVTYNNLFKLYSNINMRMYNSGGRPVPFAFHICGRPGIGKTMMHPVLMRDALGYTRDDIYELPIGQEYESGYIDQPVYHIDEFLLDPTAEKKAEQLHKILSLISANDYRPNYASVDDPNQGIKGNLCRPEVVTMMNNNIYDNVDMAYSAFYRRRRFVVRMVPNNRFIGIKSNSQNVDLEKYSKEDIANFVWANFEIYSPIPPKTGTAKPSKVLAYPEFVQFVRDQYADHNEVQKQITEALGEDITCSRDPEEVINEVFREVFELPTRNYSLLQCAKEAIKPTWNKWVHATVPVVAESNSEEITEEFERCVNGEEGCVFSTISDLVKPTYGLLSLAILAACVVVKKIIVGAAELPTFVAESDKPNKETRRNISKRAARIHKASGNPVMVVAESELIPTASLTLVGDQNLTTVRGVLVKDRWILTVSHILNQISNKQKWVLEYKKQTFEVPYNEDLILVDEGSDFCLLYFNNKQFPQMKDRIRLFATDAEIDLYSDSFVKLDFDGKQMVSPCRKIRSLMMQVEKQDGSVEPRVIDEALEYHAETRYGMCGTPVRVIDGPCVGKILGTHIAGNKDKSMSIQAHANFVSQEMLRTVITAAESNIYRVEDIPFNQVVNMPEKSKLKKTFLYDKLNHENAKEPAILSANDVRARGIDPVEKSLEVLDNCNGYEIHIEDLKRNRVKGRLLEKYRKMIWPVGKRELTFEEALKGVAGKFNAIKMNSSAGYPLCKTASKPGKQDYCWFENGEIKYTEAFKCMVEDQVEKMRSYEGGEIHHRFLQFMKDELLKKKKIESVTTRAIFANDLIFLVAARMLFGALMCAFQNNYEITGFAIGLNQNSEDMNRIVRRHNKFARHFDGDYAGFDQHYVEECQNDSYWIFGQLALEIPTVNQNCVDYFVNHETKSPIQVKDKLIWVRCSNKSGCCITTIINCIMNAEYVGLCFAELEPNLSYEENVVDSYLGDDNIVSVSDAVSFSPADMQREMAVIGQEYTAADKESSIEEWKKIGDCMFLGSHPILQDNGVWTGALRKNTLEETPKWTRDNGVSTELTCQQMLDYASQWDKEYFDDYAKRMKQCFIEAGKPWRLNDNYYDLHHVVANRTTDSGKDFYRTIVAESQLGLTQIPTNTYADQFYNEEKSDQEKIVSKAIGADAVSLNYGVESYVRRATFAWSSTDVYGADIYQVDVPFGILGLLDDHNLQNMPFEHTVYSAPDVELIFQVNGNPMQQGILVAYFQPLDLVTSPEIQNVTTLQHTFITPNQSTTTSLTIPYRHFASALRNRLGLAGEDYENLGRLHFSVLSVLKTITLPTTVDVTIYSRFKGKFYLPSAVAESSIVAEGGTQSTINYNISDVAGNVPIQNDATTSNSTTATASLPLDNPPMSGGGIPVYNQFSSLAKICGVEPTITLGEHPAMLCRQPDVFRNVNETLISEILGKRGFLQKVSISTSNATGSRLLDININSLFCDNGATMPWTIPANLAVLNNALRYRGDIIFDIVAAKTHFHSFRLIASLGYGQTAVIGGTENSFITQVLDFNNETSWASIKMPWNNRYEYCRVFEGRKTLVQDVTEYGLGTLALTVANELRYANNVATSVELMIFVRFENVEIVGMRPFNNIDWTEDGQRLIQIIAESELTPNVIGVEEGDAEETQVTPIANTETSVRELPEQPCRLKVGSKYEYSIRDVVEFGRRHQRISPYNYFIRPGHPHTGNTVVTRNHSFEVYPVHWLNRLYAGWSGTLKYRIFVNYRAALGSTNTHPTVVYIPNPSTRVDAANVNIEFFNADSLDGAIDATWDSVAPLTHVARQTGTYCQGAEERMWQHTSTYAYIDVSVPFYSEHNFLPTRTSYHKNNWSNGRLVVTIPELTTTAKLEIYQAFGDDFRYHCWSPYSLVRYKPVLQTSGDAPPADAIVGLHSYA